MSTEAQLKALSNSELASGTQIPALKHRTVNNAIIEEMYDAQSRGNVLSGVQTATSLASGDQVFVIRSGEAYLLDADELGFVSTLADLTDVNIPAPSNDQVLAYNFGTSKWMSKDVSSLSSVVSITGTATTNQMVKFTGLSSIGNSIVSDDGTTVNIAGNLSVDNNLTVGTINSGTATDFVKGDGSLDGTTYQDEAEKNQANGYAPLDSGAKIPLANLPDSILGQVSYQGTWAASTNTPTLDNPPASTTKGEYYVASDDGTQFGIEFKTGDWIISNGTAWEKVDNTDAVTSVFGRLGNVVANSTDYENFYVDFTSNQSISGTKTFDNNTLRLEDAGNGLVTVLGNINSNTSTDGGLARFGFNFQNNIFFSKGVSVGFNAGVFAFNNTDARTYTLPDASGTFAFTSDLNTLNASNITTGTLADAMLSNNVALKDDDNNFSVGQTINGTLNGTSAVFSSTLSVVGNATVGAEMFRPSTDSFLRINGGGSTVDGASILMFGSTHPSAAGRLNLGSVGSESIIFSAGGADRLTITSAGNVGIGATSPEKLLEVKGESGDGIRINELGDSYHDIYIQGGDLIIAADTRGDNNENLIFANGSDGERMRIDSSGNVGIGTTSPSEKLDVAGNIKTASPSGGTAQPFKIGEVETPGAGYQYGGKTLKVEIDGVVYRLMIAEDIA